MNRDRFIKRLSVMVLLCLPFALPACAQEWTAQDSLRLKRLLESDHELELNADAVKSIDFGGLNESPRISEEKRWLLFDESLPQALPKPKRMLTLRPYTPTTPYNWDPVYQREIRPDEYAKWNDLYYQASSGGKIPIGHKGVYIKERSLGGLDMMAMFTEDFWNRKRLETRKRAMEALKYYGDSVTVLINHPISNR